MRQFDTTAGHTLSGIAFDLERNREFLLSLTKYRVINADTVLDVQKAEEAVHELLAPAWVDAQDELARAGEDELDATDTTWMGERMPGHFDGMTVQALKAAVNTRSRAGSEAA